MHTLKLPRLCLYIVSTSLCAKIKACFCPRSVTVLVAFRMGQGEQVSVWQGKLLWEVVRNIFLAFFPRVESGQADTYFDMFDVRTSGSPREYLPRIFTAFFLFSLLSNPSRKLLS